MASREAIYQEFYNNEELQGVLLYNAQSTGTVIASGCSTFGKVEKIKVGLSIRAGKIFDDKIYNKVLQQLSKTIIVTNFVQECRRIIGIDHLNIVKVIGMCILPNQIFPTLVMELLDNNLHQYLETHHNIPLVIKHSILEDVAKGLLFLHTQSPDPIVHRDLTAYNVLLTSSLVAKVSDIGNSNFADLARKHGGGVAYSPKVKAYMPPEFEDKCAPSMDVFSYGHLILFCSIQVLPDDLLPSTYSHMDTVEMLVLRSEVDRRKEYFKQMDLKLPHGNKHPLVELAKECLQDDPTKRPLTENVLERLRQMVDEMGRIPDDHDSMDRMEVIKLLHQQDSLHTIMPKEKEEYLSKIYALDSENEDLRMKVHSVQVQSSKDLEDKDNVISDKNIQLSEIEQQVEKLQAEQTMMALRFKEALTNITQKQDHQKQLLSECREKVKALRNEEEELQMRGDVELSQLIRDAQLLTDMATMQSPKKSSVLDMSWDQLPDFLTPLPKHPCAVYLNGLIYVGGALVKDHAHTVFVFNPEQPESWSQLAKCPRKNFGMAAINNMLVIVGGVDSSHKKSSKVTVWDSTAQQWKEGFYPALLQARASPHVTVYKNWLLVIAGTADKTLNAIERLDVESNKPWTQCPPLPDRCADISSVMIEHTLYVAGTAIGASEPGKMAYSVLLPLLIRIKAKDNIAVWERLPAIPNTTASLCSVSRKSVLTFGGEVELMSSLSMLSPIFILRLQEAATKWERVGSLPIERNCCTCLRVGGNKVVLLGGTQPQVPEGLKRVDVGTLQGQK